MKITEKMKIIFNLKRYSYEDLTLLKKYIDDEYNKRKQVLNKLRK